MSLSNVNIRVGATRTIGNIRITLPNSAPAAQLPITLKNNYGDVPTVEQLRNVTDANKGGSETLVYNANTGRWEERILNLSDISSNTGNIDCGSF